MFTAYLAYAAFATITMCVMAALEEKHWYKSIGFDTWWFALVTSLCNAYWLFFIPYLFCVTDFSSDMSRVSALDHLVAAGGLLFTCTCIGLPLIIAVASLCLPPFLIACLLLRTVLKRKTKSALSKSHSSQPAT